MMKGKGRENGFPAIICQGMYMKYAIKVNEVKKENGNVKGFATVVFGDSFKITNIAIVENKDKGQLFVSMPRYKANERSEDGSAIYKDVCNPITAEFREELYSNILEEYERVQAQGEPEKGTEKDVTPPEFSVTVTPYEREGSNIRLYPATAPFPVSVTVPLPAPAAFPSPPHKLSQSLNKAFHGIPLLPDSRCLGRYPCHSRPSALSYRKA